MVNTMPEMPNIKATQIKSPPTWAILERRLMTLMEQGAFALRKKYFEPNGAPLWADDVDDFYEQCYNWGLFYAMGGDERLRDYAMQNWETATRICSQGITHRTETRFRQNIYREYYSLDHPGDAEWHHKGEGNMAWYDFGVAMPDNTENVRRARRFADLHTGDDPEAPNYDKKHKVLRSPAQASDGPWHKAKLVTVMTLLHGGNPEKTGMSKWVPKPQGIRASLWPIMEPEIGWWKDPKRAEEVIKAFEHIVLDCDSANNLAAAAQVTDAYLYTGDPKYKQWVVEYVDAWMDRIKQNGGIIPDNVGPTGKPGEHRNGVWHGGFYGWGHYQGFNIMFHGMTIAAECALLLTGDMKYADLLRSQTKVLVDNGFKLPNGQIMTPTRYDQNDWDLNMEPHGSYTGPAPVRAQELVHLYHMTLSQDDHNFVTSIRVQDVVRDWNTFNNSKGYEKNSGEIELARFQYYDGKNPNWPDQVLSAEYGWVLEQFNRVMDERRTTEQLVKDNEIAPTVVHTKALS